MVDVYQVITDRIIEQLEIGTIPWQRRWSGCEAGMPRNLISRNQYRGVNTFLLSCMPHESPYWLTFKQAKAIGGHVLKGQKSTPVIFWKWYESRNPETGETEQVPVLRYYNVFNIEQCDIPEAKLPESATPETFAFEPIQACESILETMPQQPAIEHGGGSACYIPQADTVRMPQPERFENSTGYYSTLFHELTHATGHASRLNRAGITDVAAFGSRTYSKEELVAEMGAAFLCGHTGIENQAIDNSAAYISGWLKKLRSDKRLVIHAAAAAQKASDFILGRKYDNSKATE